MPDNLIHALGLKPGTELAFERQGDTIIMRPIKKPNKISRVEDGPQILDYTGPTVTLEDMKKARNPSLLFARINHVYFQTSARCACKTALICC